MADHPLDIAEAADPSRPQQPRDDAGRFASKDVEPEVGRQAEAHNAGRRTLLDHKLENEGPDPDERSYGSDEGELRRAARDLAARRRGDEGGLEVIGDRIGTKAEAEEERHRKPPRPIQAHLPKRDPHLATRGRPFRPWRRQIRGCWNRPPPSIQPRRRPMHS
jgi:hypothetical protein